MKRIVIAVPTIPERGDAWKKVANEWRAKTRHPVEVVPSWVPSSWCDGLTDVWQRHPDATLFVCGSDDMTPADDEWLPSIEPYLDKGCIAPQVLDPRFARFDDSVQNGSETPMSSFPILAGRFLDKVFPLPAGLHYYGDNLVSDRLRAHGVPTIAVPSCVIVHGFDERGRGAGMGDESTRMAHDKRIYKRLLTSIT